MRLPGTLAGAPSMTTRTWLSTTTAAVLLAAAACSGNSKPQTQPKVAVARAIQAPAPAVVAPPPSDPIATLIQSSKNHFEAGERELKVGHLEQAREIGRASCRERCRS